MVVMSSLVNRIRPHMLKWFVEYLVETLFQASKTRPHSLELMLWAWMAETLFLVSKNLLRKLGLLLRDCTVEMWLLASSNHLRKYQVGWWSQQEV
jgi:hypothetical protein